MQAAYKSILLAEENQNLDWQKIYKQGSQSGPGWDVPFMNQPRGVDE